MGQAKQRKAEIAKLKILSEPREVNGFDMFWQADKIVNEDGLYDLSGITAKIGDWAAHLEGFGFKGPPSVEVSNTDKVNHPVHQDCIMITLKWNHWVKVDIPQSLSRLRYVLQHGDNGYSGAEFYCRVEDIEEMRNALKDLEYA
jgi:hypothetical protein